MILTDISKLKGALYGCYGWHGETIYSLVNLDNGKRYIGKTTNPKERINIHLQLLKRHCHKNPLLNNDSHCRFGFEILKENASTYPISDERIYMLLYRTNDEEYGYNANDPMFTRAQKNRERSGNAKGISNKTR